MFWLSLRVLQVLGLALSLGLAGCNLQPNGEATAAEAQLRASLAAQLEQHQQAHQQASAHWDQVVLGEAVNCARGLAVPPTLTPLPSDSPPSAETVHTALAQSQSHLASSARIWDEICADTSVERVAPALVDLGYLNATQAASALQAANDALVGWQP